MRIFVALLFDDINRERIYSFQDRFKAISEKGNYTTLNNLHLTMQFIGETEVMMVDEIANKLSEIKAKKFTYQTGDIRFFKKSQNRKLLYLSLNDTYKLKQLYIKISAKLNELGYNFPANKFTPHITLARQVLLPEGYDNELFKVEKLNIEAVRISLMESTRINGELTYIELYSTPLLD